MNETDLLRQCVLYFKNNRGFKRVFEKMKEKYKSLGAIGGIIVLTGLSVQEQEALTGFLKKDYTKQKSASIKVENFEKALDKTRFAGLNLEDILKEYFHEELVSNKEKANIYKQRREDFFKKIIDAFEGTLAGDWVRHVLQTRENAYITFIKRYDMDENRLKEDIHIVCIALNNLPCLTDQKKRLAMFASEISKNPHIFDEGTECGQLLQYAIMYRFNAVKPQNAEEKAELFYKAGILVDEISNYTVCCGLKGYIGGQIHPGWEGYYTIGEPMQVSLANLSKLDAITSPIGKVFVFENPAVFSTVLDQLSCMYPPLICTYGQVKLASLVLLDMLAKQGTTIYYSGDFDPEGLLIADKLKKRYGSQLILWRYHPKDYEAVRSNKKISVCSIKKLENIQDEQLRQLGQCLKEQGDAGYQEALIDVLIEDIYIILEKQK
jgi:uncharacterized protein (TIGR02679 family)